jgi:hypothetical protein
MSDQDKVIERIRKLLAMADDVSSPNEAMIAAKRARALMDKHQISKDDVRSAGDDMFLESESSYEGRTFKTWARILHGAAARLNDCRGVLSKRINGDAKFMFQGFKADALVAKMTVEYFVSALEDALGKCSAKGVSEKNYFRVGFAMAVSQKVDVVLEERERTLKTSAGKSLVLCKEQAVSEHFGYLQSAKAPEVREPTLRESIAYELGNKAGGKVGLDPQVESGPKRASIGAIL